MNLDLPYKIKYSRPDNFHCCNGCQLQFKHNDIQIAAMVQSKHDDRKDPIWHHKQCFFQNYRIESIEEIENFEGITYNDQTDILMHIDPRQKLKLESIRESIDELLDPSSPKHFGIEYSTSDIQCSVCNATIPRNEIRIKKVVYDGKIAANFGKEILWHHLHCFLSMRMYNGFVAGGEMLPGFNELLAIHQKIVKEMLCPLDITQQSQCHVEEPAENESRNEFNLEITIANQSAELIRVRQALQKMCSEEELQLFLIFNDSDVIEGLDNLLDRCADFLTFGALYKCQKCNKGDMIFTKNGYTCNAMTNEWIKCGHFEEKPLRLKCTIPDEMRQNPFFSTCSLIVEHRAVRACNNEHTEEHLTTKSNKSTPHCPKTSKITNVKIKDGAVVDPKSCLENECHVFRRDGVFYTTALALIDIQNNKNSYYKIQVLESDLLPKYWLFSSWGRIGTEIGDFKVEPFTSRDVACNQFEALFENQTANHWTSQSFKKVPGKFYPIDISYIDDIVANDTIASKLSPEVVDLTKLLFDIEMMKQTMELDFHLDLERLPLGKLSLKQLNQAYSVLTELKNLIVANGSKTELIGLSEKFFTLIPHNFGLEKLPILDTLNKMNEKRAILDSLWDIAYAYSMMGACVQTKHLNSFDAYYQQLNADIQLLKRDSPEHKMIETYISKSHVYISVDIFHVNRHGENARFAPYQNLPNRKLLWHGSRISNFASILSNGLRICQPVNGSTYGRGIYLADMCIKSVSYCDERQKSILLALAEVARYKTYQGGSYPDPTENYIQEDGLIIPLGKICGSSSGTCTEYVVDNEEHIKIKYLVKLISK